MLELEEALQKILHGLKPLPSEMVPVIHAAGRVLSESISAPAPLPAFDNSAMDGFAVRAADTVGASPENPAVLQLQGAVAAGDKISATVSPGACVRVFTGAPLPPGADAVVMQEDTSIDGANPNLVRVLDAAKPWENVRFGGEDVKPGEQVCEAGETMTPERLGLLSALGLAELPVRRRPVLGLLATGSELVEPGQPLASGKIYESNRTILATLLPRLGAVPRIYPVVPDYAEATRDALQRAFAECDAIVSTGGVSVGAKDFVKSSFEEIGGQLSFWRVAIKPGKPLVFGKWKEKLFFGLPGNPVSAFVTFLLLVRPAILKLQAAVESELRHLPGTLLEPLVNHGNRRHFMRVFRDAQGNVSLAGTQASHILRSLARSNGLVDVPPETALSPGASVEVLAWD